MIKTIKSSFKYAKSFIVSPKNIDKTIWSSVLLIFHDGEKLCIDYAFIVIGNIPKHYLSYYINFNNWSVINDKLYYTGRKTPIEVYPENIYLYVKISNNSLDKNIILNNPDRWENFVSTSNDKLFNIIKPEFKRKKIKMIDLSYKFPYKSKILNTSRSINHPMFNRVQYCEDDRVIFSELYYRSL